MSHSRFPHLKTREVLSLSTGGHADTPRRGQGTRKRTLSPPSYKNLTPHLIIQSRTSLTLNLSQQHRFQQLQAILCTFTVLVYFQCCFRAVFAPAIFAGALDADSLLPACARQVGALSLQMIAAETFCNVKISHLVSQNLLKKRDVTPPPATNYPRKCIRLHIALFFFWGGGLEK